MPSSLTASDAVVLAQESLAIADHLSHLPDHDDLVDLLLGDFRSILDVPGTPPLPDWVTSLRPHQAHAIAGVIEAYRSGSTIVILDAPTGAGKTLIAEATSRLMAVEKTLYVATTKSLQHQFLHDFPHAHLLMGRSNYPTLDYPELFDPGSFASLDCGTCSKEKTTLPACDGCTDTDEPSEDKHPHCVNCHPVEACPYTVAKQTALRSRLAVTNTAYLMIEANMVGGLSGRPFAIVDEADTLETLLLDRVAIDIPAKWAKRWRVPEPSKRTVASAWLSWAEAQSERLTVSILPDVARALKSNPRDRSTQSEHRALTTAITRLKRLKIDLTEDEGGWVFDSKYADRGGIQFKPVRIGRFARGDLWAHAGRWLLMSATFINPDLYVDELGITAVGSIDGRGVRGGQPGPDSPPTLPAIPHAAISVPAVFPAANRPVHVIPGPKMVHKEKATGWPEMVQWISGVLAHHPDERIVVHANSYALSAYLYANLITSRHAPRILTYTSGDQREGALHQYRSLHAGVIIAPSLDRGIDLPEDDCRVQIIAKIPYPSLVDPQINARLYSYRGQEWYSTNTVRTIVQMTGRGVRSRTDTATTYICDGKFMSLWSQNRMLFPRWWREAVSFQGVPGLQKDTSLIPSPVEG